MSWRLSADSRPDHWTGCGSTGAIGGAGWSVRPRRRDACDRRRVPPFRSLLLPRAGLRVRPGVVADARLPARARPTTRMAAVPPVLEFVEAESAGAACSVRPSATETPVHQHDCEAAGSESGRPASRSARGRIYSFCCSSACCQEAGSSSRLSSPRSARNRAAGWPHSHPDAGETGPVPPPAATVGLRHEGEPAVAIERLRAANRPEDGGFRVSASAAAPAGGRESRPVLPRVNS
jgi:hypothetical protein